MYPKRRNQCWGICYPNWRDSMHFQPLKVINQNRTLNSLQFIISVTNVYPLCRNSQKSTPNSQKRRRRPMSKIRPSNYTFLLMWMHSSIIFE